MTTSFYWTPDEDPITEPPAGVRAWLCELHVDAAEAPVNVLGSIELAEHPDHDPYAREVERQMLDDRARREANPEAMEAAESERQTRDAASFRERAANLRRVADRLDELAAMVESDKWRAEVVYRSVAAPYGWRDKTQLVQCAAEFWPVPERDCTELGYKTDGPLYEGRRDGASRWVETV